MLASSLGCQPVARNMKLPGSRLAREISLVVVCKFVALVLLYEVLFSPSHRLPGASIQRDCGR